MKTNSFYRNLFISFCLVTAIYLIIITWIYGYMSMTLLQERESSYLDKKIESLTLELANDITLASNITQSLVFDDNTNNIASGIEPYINALAVQKHLRSFSSLYNSKSFDVMVYNHSLDLYVSSTTSGSLKALNNVFDIPPSITEGIIHKEQSGVNIIPNQSNLILSNYYTYPNQTSIYIFIKLSVDNFINRHQATGDKINIFFNDTPIYTGFDVYHDHLSVRQTILPIGTNNHLRLEAATPSIPFFSFIKSTFSRRAFWFIPLIISSFIIVMIATKFLFKPINALFSKISLPDESDTEKDPFHRLESYLATINSDNESLKKHLQDYHKYLNRERMLRDLFYGVVDQQTLSNELMLYQLVSDTRIYGIMIVESQIEKTLFDDLVDHNRMRKLHTMSLLETILTSELKNMIFELRGFKFCVLLLEPIQSPQLIDKIINSTQQKNDAPLKYVFISVNVQLDQISKFTLRLLESLDTTPSDELQEQLYYPSEIEDMLIQATINKDVRYKDALLNLVLYENLVNRTLNHEQRNTFVLNIASTIHKICSLAQQPLKSIFKDGDMILIALKTTHSNKNLEQMIRDYFSSLIGAIHTKNSSSDITNENITSLELMEYIHTHYNKDIALNDLADYFNLTPTYMSYLFKMLTEHTFKDYLNRYRVEKAKHFLRENTDIHLQELSEQIGCNNTQTLLRIFKKYTGKTPKQYTIEAIEK